MRQIRGESVMSVRVRCRKTGAPFEVAADDLAFLERVSPVIGRVTLSLPHPTLTPELRAMRRLAWRDAHVLFRRPCDKTGQSVVSAYPEDCPYPVYGNAVWWSDEWDATDFGLELDFGRPFFDQFAELMLRAPRPALMNRDPDNSEYCNYAGQNKNCYMANNGSWYNEGCLLGDAYLRSRDSLDCSYLKTSELCYEVTGGEGLYECTYSVDCHHSANCHLSLNLRGCRDCFLCSNLRNKRGYVLNEPASDDRRRELREKMRTASGIAELLAAFEDVRRDSLHPAVHQVNCEQCSGDYLANCKNVGLSFLVTGVRDAKHLLHCDDANDLWDCSLAGYAGAELYYESVSSGDGGGRVIFSSRSWASSDSMYCDIIMSCRHVFGCVGLKREEYCILNKRYSRADYEKLVPKLVAHMRETKEWGEFFPEELAPCAYDDSHAMDFYPLTQSEAVALGYRWSGTHSSATSSTAPKRLPPDEIGACTDAVCKETFECEQSGKPYRIVARERALLEQLGIALPRCAPDIRRRRRAGLRNKPLYWERMCDACGEAMLTTFGPGRSETICCQECYLKAIHG